MCVLSLRQKQTLALSSPWLGPRNLADKTKGYNFTSRGLLTYGGAGPEYVFYSFRFLFNCSNNQLLKFVGGLKLYST